MADKMNIRLDGIPDSQIERAISRVRTYANSYPDRRGRREGAIYAPLTGSGPSLFVYRTKAGRLVCRLLRGKDND